MVTFDLDITILRGLLGLLDGVCTRQREICWETHAYSAKMVVTSSCQRSRDRMAQKSESQVLALSDPSICLTGNKSRH